MSFEQFHLRKVIRRYLSGKSTEKEQKFLISYYDFFEKQNDFLNSISPEEKERLKENIKDKIFKNIKPIAPIKTKSDWQFWLKAAILLIFCTAGGYFIFRRVPEKQLIVHNRIIDSKRKKAMLTMANGQKIILDDTKSGLLTQQDGANVTKTISGQLIYQSKDGFEEDVYSKLNKIETPKGGQYQIVLADGTHVWLNAASSLTYPVAFRGAERRVLLKGEAYFEVQKNKKMPFIVSVNQTEVKVLGTHFNIMGYNDEASTKVTLLEGSVMVNNNNIQKILKPGQQANIKDDIVITQADGEESIAWKNGYFRFANEHIESVMRKISRWYDYDVEYQGKMTKEQFVGTMPYSQTLSETLHTLEITGLVHFKIIGRRIIVMP